MDKDIYQKIFIKLFKQSMENWSQKTQGLGKKLIIFKNKK